jgi:hypothetical protein
VRTRGRTIAATVAAGVAAVALWGAQPAGAADGSANPTVTNPAALLADLAPNGVKQKVTFNPDPGAPDSSSSHAQGYAKYGDFHLIPYSNLYGREGYVYIASDKASFTLKVPANQIRFKDVSPNDSDYNPHFNHPSGIQVIGHYLVVPVIPYMSTNRRFYDAAIVYVYDLSPLDQATPQAPSTYKEILRIPRVNGASLSSVGITQLTDGRFALGVVTDNKLDVFTSSATSDLWNATWSTTATTPPSGCNGLASKAGDQPAVPLACYTLKASSGEDHYQGNSLFLNQNGDVNMIAFDNRGGDDFADLYSVTTGGGTWPSSNATLNTTYEKHLIATGANTRNGSGVQILGPSDIVLYATDANYADGGIVINSWRDKLSAAKPNHRSKPCKPRRCPGTTKGTR